MKQIPTKLLILAKATLALFSPALLTANLLGAGDVAVGVEPSGWNAFSEYESVSAFSTRNLRLQSKYSVYFHSGGNEVGVFWPDGRLEVFSSFYTYGGGLALKPQNTSTEGGELQLHSASTAFNSWFIDHYSGQLRFSNYIAGATHVFDPNGNVGIGTTTPDYKLDVNGAIRAKEFFVETGWSDFVFEDDYELPSLDYVKGFIDENGHLPGIPSAKEIQAKGLEMGSAQTLMMQKIEELTLYVLQLKDENQELKSRLSNLETELRK